jgi:hypothetical protein
MVHFHYTTMHTRYTNAARRSRSTGRKMHRETHDSFPAFEDVWDSLSSGRGSLFADDMRRRVEQEQYMTNLRFVFPTRDTSSSTPYYRHAHTQEKETRHHGYATETRVPSTPYYRTEDYTDPSSARSRRTYQTQERMPGAAFEEKQYTRGPWGAAYGYNHGYHYNYNYSHAAPYAQFPPDSYPYSSPPPKRTDTHGSRHRSREAYYTTEERQPRFNFPESPEKEERYTNFDSGSYPRTPPPFDSSSSTHDSPSSPPPVGIKPRIDLYAVLNLARNATGADVKKAYRAMSLKWHPDRCKGEDRFKATKKMAEINQAKDVLGDEQKKAHYDRWGMIPSDL